MTETQAAEAIILDEMGMSTGTDKTSIFHDYLRHYERIFARFKNEPINVFEIGVLGGASLKMWERFFTRARIIGIDIKAECQKYATERTTIEIGSQADVNFLESIVTKYPPTIIIDDGSHRADHIRISFEYLFPRLLLGGIYSIEDLYFHFGDRRQDRRGQAKLSAYEYIALLAVYLAQRGMTGKQSVDIDPQLLNSIDHLTFIPRAALVSKRAATSYDFERLIAFAEQADNPQNWLRLAEFLLEHGGSREIVERALFSAISTLHGGRWPFYLRLAKQLERNGNVTEAIEVLRRAHELVPAARKKEFDEQITRLARVRTGRKQP